MNIYDKASEYFNEMGIYDNEEDNTIAVNYYLDNGLQHILAYAIGNSIDMLSLDEWTQLIDLTGDKAITYEEYRLVCNKLIKEKLSEQIFEYDKNSNIDIGLLKLVLKVVREGTRGGNVE